MIIWGIYRVKTLLKFISPVSLSLSLFFFPSLSFFPCLFSVTTRKL